MGMGGGCKQQAGPPSARSLKSNPEHMKELLCVLGAGNREASRRTEDVAEGTAPGGVGQEVMGRLGTSKSLLSGGVGEAKTLQRPPVALSEVHALQLSQSVNPLCPACGRRVPESSDSVTPPLKCSHVPLCHSLGVCCLSP